MGSRSVASALMLAVAALYLLAGLRTPASACGHCVEDKVAATFDYAVLTRAAREGHVVVFTEIRGRAAGGGPALEAFIARALAATSGVDAGTSRVSLEPAAASFACDPSRRTPGALVAAVNTRLAARALRLAVIKIDPGVRPR